KNKDFLFGEFNAWAYEYNQNIQAAMAHEVINGLTRFQVVPPEGETDARQSKWQRFKQLFKQRTVFIVTHAFRYLFSWLPSHLWLLVSFSARKHPWRLLFLLLQLVVLTVLWQFVDFRTLSWDIHSLTNAGIEDASFAGLLVYVVYRLPKDFGVSFAQTLTKDWLTYIRLPNYARHIGEVSEMRKDIGLMSDICLRSDGSENPLHLRHFRCKKRLLFIVDDLDRCGPDGIVKTFEAIRLVLNIPQVTVIIAIDQRIALAALAKHYEPVEKHHPLQNAKTIARDYLGKMIQLPILLPEPDRAGVCQLMAATWGDNEQENKAWQKLIEPRPSAPEDVEPEVALTDQIETDDDDVPELTAEELAKSINDMPMLTLESEPKIIIGLSPQQKAAFVYWCEQFQINNPRQLKRLHNSYNLLRTVNGREDAALNNEQLHTYPWLIALILLESINSKEDAKARNWLRDLVLNGECVLEYYDEPYQTALTIIQTYAANDTELSRQNRTPEAARVAMLQYVDCYVLPAVEEST
ncbi:MAG: P-loop NTPase fold protein, partial [Reinekea sp.]